VRRLPLPLASTLSSFPFCEGSAKRLEGATEEEGKPPDTEEVSGTFGKKRSMASLPSSRRLAHVAFLSLLLFIVWLAVSAVQSTLWVLLMPLESAMTGVKESLAPVSEATPLLCERPAASERALAVQLLALCTKLTNAARGGGRPARAARPGAVHFLRDLEGESEVKGSLSESASSLELPSPGPWHIVHTPQLAFFAAVGVWKEHLVIVFRGTVDYRELVRNDLGTELLSRLGTGELRRLFSLGMPNPCPPQVALSGARAATALGGEPLVSAPFFLSCNGAVEDEVLRHVALLSPRAPKGLLVSGHSLGAAVACLCAATIRLAPGQPLPQMRLVVFASPEPGNAAFQRLLASRAKCTCYANDADAIPWLPLSVVPDFTDRAGMLQYSSPPGLCVFSCQAPSLTEAHSQEAYSRGLESFGRTAKADRQRVCGGG